MLKIALTPIRDKILICQTFRSTLRPSSVAMYKNNVWHINILSLIGVKAILSMSIYSNYKIEKHPVQYTLHYCSDLVSPALSARRSMCDHCPLAESQHF